MTQQLPFDSGPRPFRPASVLSLAHRFLGPAHATGGPFALLGMTTSDCDEQQVMAALDHQLARLNTDPQGETPEADELRLALHAAAAQLLDPTTRHHLTRQWGGGSAESHRTHPPAQDRTHSTQARAHHHSPRPASRQGQKSAPPPQQPHKPVPSNDLEARALQYVAQHGGWTPAAMRQISLLVQSKGLPPTEVTRLVRALASQPRPAAPAEADSHGSERPPQDSAEAGPPPRPGAPSHVHARSAPAQPRPVPVEDKHDHDEAVDHRSPGPSPLRALPYAAALVFVLLTAAVVIALFLADSPPAQVAQQDEQASVSDPPASEAPAHSSPETRTSPQDETGTATDPAEPRKELSEQSLRDSFGSITQNPAAATEALDRLAANWTQLSPTQRTAAHDGLIEALHNLVQSEQDTDVLLGRIIDHAAPLLDKQLSLQPGDEFHSAVWAAGMINRLRAEQELPASTSDRVRTTWRQFGMSRPDEHTFAQGTRVALNKAQQDIVASDQSPHARLWDDWILMTSEADLSQRHADGLILNALDSIIYDGQDLTSSSTTHESLTKLVNAMDWSEAGQARGWLVSLYDDDQVSPTHINMIIAALNRESPEAMIVREASIDTASSTRELARMEARDALKQDWGFEGPEARVRVGRDWASAFTQTVDRLDTDSSLIDAIATAALLARLSQAAAHIFDDDTAAATSVLENLDEPLAQASAAVADASTYPETHAADGRWATEYLAVSNRLSPRLELLARFPASGTVGQIDGAVLAREALLGNHPQIRTTAIAAASRYAREPAIVHGILDVLPDVQRTHQVTEFLQYVTGESLPAPSSSNWSHEARRAVVERLLELIATQSDDAAIESFASTIATAHLASTGRSPGDEEINQVQAATSLHAHWRAHADRAVPPADPPITIDQVERNHAARSGVAAGPVQRFAVEQLAACELMALVVASEQRHRAQDIRRILDDLTAQRRSASHILEQIRHVEHARARLWAIRIGGAEL